MLHLKSFIFFFFFTLFVHILPDAVSDTFDVFLLFYVRRVLSSLKAGHFCVCSLVELAANSIQEELGKRKSHAHAWNNSAIDLVRASDVSPVSVCVTL